MAEYFDMVSTNRSVVYELMGAQIQWFKLGYTPMTVLPEYQVDWAHEAQLKESGCSQLMSPGVVFPSH